MTAAYFEDHPTDPDKVIFRKPPMKVEGPVHVVCHCDKCKAQPQRVWLDLTDEEMLKIEETTTCLVNESWLRNLTRNIEAKLKEKNND